MSHRYKWIPDSVPIRVLSAMSETEDYNIRMMNIPEMWKRTRGAGIRVAVLDTGLPRHVDLPRAEGQSFVEGYVYDVQGHSTFATGIVAACANGLGVVGIAPECTVVHGTVLDESGSGTMESIVAGIRWAVDTAKVDIINMSLGIQVKDTIQELQLACDYAYGKGVAIFAAAGNEGGAVGQPARYDSVFAVAAVNNRLQRADFSSYGDEIDFAAGGVDVYSTHLNNSYCRMSGTSMASPALVGVAALILADSLKEGVRLTPEQLRVKLNEIAYNPDVPGGWDRFDGRGIPVFSSGFTPIPVNPPVPPITVSRWTRFLEWVRRLFLT